MDAQAVVDVGPCSRGGTNRIPTEASDHDFHPKAGMIPDGILLPDSDELFLYLSTSKVTSALSVDLLPPLWEQHHQCFAKSETLLLNPDNRPESHSRRTQFIKRLVEFAHKDQINVQLAYYPPVHSKSNPIQRTWAALELHWHGTLLALVDTVVPYAHTSTWKGKHPTVTLVTPPDSTGVRLTQVEIQQFEEQLQRQSHIDDYNQFDLGRWFVYISAPAS